MGSARRQGRARPVRRLGYGLQTAVLLVLYALVWPLPLNMASALCGWLLRTAGPRTSLHRRGAANIRLAYPGIEQERVRAILAGMWDNFGRVGAEYAHLATLRRQERRVQVVGGDILDRLRGSGRPVLFFGAHLGNWEAIIQAAQRHGFNPCVAYRRFNNPGVERLGRWVQRGSGAEYVGVRAGSGGMRRMAAILGAGGQAVLLVDQRMNQGVAIPFFGFPAMTSTAPARLAARFDAALVPMHVERLDGSNFRVTAEAPIQLPGGGLSPAQETAVMESVNQRIEAWIRARPEQWLWLHRRWPKHAKS